MVKMSSLAANMTSGRRNAIATAITGVTAEEIAGLQELLQILASRPDLAQPILMLSSVAKTTLNLR